MSAGNYGKSFAYACKHYGFKGKVVMPETAPIFRSVLIQSLGVEVERVPTTHLMDVVNRSVQEDSMTFQHSYYDPDIIAGHASLGFEILEVVPYPDVVAVCYGGGGLLAGVAAAIKLSGGENTKIYGVEPEVACTVYKSFIEKKPVGMDAKSIESGLAPPFAGSLPYELGQKYVENIVLVTDEEIKSAVSTFYKAGLVVEPSGTVVFAAIMNNKIPFINGKNVMVILSEGNIGIYELSNFPEKSFYTVPSSSVGYTIMGKTADLTVVQKMTIDTLHKEGKTQKVIAKEAGCSQSSVSKHINREAKGRKRHDSVRSVSPGLKIKRTGLLLSSPKLCSLMKVNFAFPLEIRVPESGGREERQRIHVA
ncbi:Phenylserine dehydratase [Labeo rohita]|uniref:L-serine deaminase n=1 Tax=Labeo rohita TaxID=84645 RepID=A0ABQ8LZF1_LABRO|nr:Phenylserine dehydratase [Labeo rohita]